MRTLPENGSSVLALAPLCIINTLKAERASYNGSIEASQASDVGSIPIARSINPIDSNTLTGLKTSKIAQKKQDFGRSWTRPCCNMVQLDATSGRGGYEKRDGQSSEPRTP